MEFYVAVDGQQDGPMPEEQVRQRILDRQLQPTDHCWMDGWEDWKPLGEIFAAEFLETAPAPLASWENLAAPESVVNPAATRARLPVRHDRTSAGIFAVIGVLSIVVLLVGAGWLLGRRGTGGEAASATSSGTTTEHAGLSGLREMEFSGSNLKQIAEACRVYAKANGGKLPTYASQLRPLFGSRFANVMDVPETPEKEESGYVVRMGLDLAMPDDTPIAFEARTRPDGKRGVVYLDGTVKVYARGHPELQRALAR